MRSRDCFVPPAWTEASLQLQHSSTHAPPPSIGVTADITSIYHLVTTMLGLDSTTIQDQDSTVDVVVVVDSTASFPSNGIESERLDDESSTQALENEALNNDSSYSAVYQALSTVWKDTQTNMLIKGSLVVTNECKVPLTTLLDIPIRRSWFGRAGDVNDRYVAWGVNPYCLGVRFVLSVSVICICIVIILKLFA